VQTTEKKICNICNIEKDVGEFHRRKYRSGNIGLQHECKSCKKERDKQYCDNNKEKVLERKKLYRQNNKEKISERHKQHYQNNKEKISEQKKQYRHNNIEKRLLFSARMRAREKGREFNLDLEDITLPEYCPVLNIKMGLGEGGKASPNSYTLDRIDNNKGYVKGNVQVISHRANSLKSNATIEELERLIQYMRKQVGDGGE